MVYVFVKKKKILLNRPICGPLFVSLYLIPWNRYFSKSLLLIDRLHTLRTL